MIKWICGLVLGLLAVGYSATHPECSYFEAVRSRRARDLSSVTSQVTRSLPAVYQRSSARRAEHSYTRDSIDGYIFAAIDERGIAPAPPTTDWEFIRRVTLDLTGRIPAPDRVLAFVNDGSANKRARLVEELLAKPEWVDKWTMYFGDLYRNAANNPSLNINRGATARNEFHKWIHESLAAEKPYNRMVNELITASGGNTFFNGPANWIVTGSVSNGPVQDSNDQSASNIFETFLGISHLNCVLCHNGRGHLDSLNLWASRATRYQTWQVASFLSHTRIATAAGLWSVQDNVSGFTSDYTLNTSTGNRPAREPHSDCNPSVPCRVPPQYIFNGGAPNAGENYRAALARYVTSDYQFARATVNYLWAEFFGRGIVEPTNGFDPARLDPDNPPPEPWTLQPSNPALLNSLAKRFIESGYNLKSVMREIAASDAYQLSSRYDGEWNVEWEPYFARHFVRRLWAEELHDAVVLSSGRTPSYNTGTALDWGAGFAMKFPDTVGIPVNNPDVTAFLDAFHRGNRDDEPRRREGSVLQALSMMNSRFVDSFLRVEGIEGSPASPLLVQNLDKGESEITGALYLAILSRLPSPAETEKSVALLRGAPRTAAIQDLAWSLYNKLDFIFNY